MTNKKEMYQNDIIFMNENDPFQIKHRKRTSKKQLEVLEKTFETCIRPDAKLRKKLGDQLGMTPRAVQIWFQNRRAKVKKSQGKVVKRKTKEKSEEEERQSPQKKYPKYEQEYYGENVYNNVEMYDTSEMYKKYDGEIYPKYEDPTNKYEETYPKYEETYPKYEETYPKYEEVYPKYDETYPATSYPANYYPPAYPPMNSSYPTGEYIPYDNAEDYYHKHHDEYYHNMYIDSNGCYKGTFDNNNVGYPPQYVDRQYYKDYYYKQYYPSQEDQDKEDK